MAIVVRRFSVVATDDVVQGEECWGSNSVHHIGDLDQVSMRFSFGDLLQLTYANGRTECPWGLLV
ncbi:hypothetical protein [Brucella sp. NBRC 12950]|uniref:hypothetical protein n=1 Tax=Brucella sp. NBRC 12950 TaxID=2994518 RepID=UPI0025546D0E|nr:hypothetical protein [Brucella sp. NBRC 12950]